jgi:site-specific recombinase XerD
MPAKGQPSPYRDQRLPGEPLTGAEVQALLSGCSSRAPTGIRNRALIITMYRAGLRLGEALALKPSDINPDRGTVRILHSKGDHDRTVSLDAGAMALVQRWADKRRELGFRNGPLFCTLAGGKLSDRYVRDMLQRVKARAGIEKRVHPHGLRHSHAAELVEEGVPVNVIQQQLGHANLATTDVYLRHIAPAAVIAMGRNRTWAETP